MTGPQCVQAACRVCGGEGPHAAHRVREMMFGTREQFAYFQCASCGCLQIEHVPEDLERHYPEGYYSFEPPPRPATKYDKWKERARNRYALFRTGVIGQRLSAKAPHRMLAPLARLDLPRTAHILDVGSGSGAYLRDIGDLGFDMVLGLDPHLPQDVVHDNGVRVMKMALADVAGTWDLITFHHSFEHVPDQQGTLEQALSVLGEDGTILLRIPVVDCAAWERYGVDWVQLDAPRHLYLHTRYSIERLAAACGLRVEAVTHDSSAFQFWGSEQYARDVPLHAPTSHATAPDESAFSEEQIAAWEEESANLNHAGRGDQACFYLKRSAAGTADPNADTQPA